MTDRSYTTQSGSGSSRPTINPQQHSRHLSTLTATTSSSSSSNLSSSLSLLSDSSSSGAEDPADASPLKRTVTAAIRLDGEAASSNTPNYAAYSTHSLGLRSFSNNILSPAQRLAKESLPSPPATSKGESERGSIGSAGTNNSQTVPDRGSSSRRTRPGLPVDAMQAAGAGDYATRRLTLDTSRSSDTAATPDSSNVRTSRTDSYLASPVLQGYGTPTPAPRLSTESVNMQTTSSTLARSRSRSPLAELRTDLTERRPSLSQRSSQASLLLARSPETSREEEVGDISLGFTEASRMVKADSIASDLSRRSSLRDKGKGREVSPAVSRSGSISISASKIRKASEATRQRMYTNPPITNMEDVPSPIYTGPSKTTDHQLAPPLNHDYSKSSSSTASESSGTALRHRSEASGSTASVRQEGGHEAFAKSNRNSVISVAERETSDLHPHLTARASSRDVVRTLKILKQERELEEGEILDETEPKGYQGITPSLTVYADPMSQVEMERPKQYTHSPRATRMSRQSSGSNHSDGGNSNRQYAVESLRRSGILSSTSTNSLRQSQDGLRAPDSPIYPASNEAISSPTSLGQRRSIRSSVSTHDLVNDGENSVRTPYRNRPTTAGSGSYYASRKAPVSESSEAAMPSHAQYATPSLTSRRYESDVPQSAGPAVNRHDRFSSISKSNSLRRGSREQPASVVPRRSQTSLANYSSKESHTDSESTSAGDFPRRTAAPLDEPQYPASISRRRTRYSYSPERESVSASSASALGQDNKYETSSTKRSATVTGRTIRDGAASKLVDTARMTRPSSRAALPSDYYDTSARNERARTPDVRQSISRANLQMSPQAASESRSRGSNRTPLPTSQSSYAVGERDVEQDKEVLGRVRARTLSTQSDRAKDIARSARRTDVFATGQTPSNDKFRTIASSRPRTAASLRDLEVGSSDWWSELNGIRQRTVEAMSERPASRASALERPARESPSPMVRDREETLRSRRSPALPYYHGEDAQTVSYQGRARRNSRSSSQMDSNSHRSDEPDKTYKRHSERIENGQSHQHTPNSRPISRSHTVQSSISTSSRKLRREDSTPTREEHLGHQQKLLLDALYAFEDQHARVPDPDTQHLRKHASAVTSNANAVHNYAKSLLAQVVAHHVETEEQEDRSNGARRAHNSSVLPHIERLATQLNRVAEDQVRSMTEMLLVMTQAEEQRTRPEWTSPGVPQRNTQVNGTPSSATVSRSNTTIPSQPRQPIYAVTHNQSPYSPPSQSRHRRNVTQLERIDSVQDNLPQSQHRRGRPDSDNPNNLPLQSPRALRRAKSSSTSQISQSTVRGMIASSPPENRSLGQYFPTSPSREASRRNSLATLENLSPEQANVFSYSPSAVLSAANPESSASSRLSQMSQTPNKSTTSRWRPFSKNRQSLQSEELPDSPSISQPVRNVGSAAKSLSSRLTR